MKFTLPLSGHTPRVVTGLSLAAVLVASLFAGGIFLQAALVLVALAALMEFYLMFWPGWQKPCSKALGLVGCLGVFFAAIAGYQTLIWILLCLSFLVAAFAFLFDYGRGNDQARLEHHAVLPLGLLYIPTVLQLALHLSTKEQLLVVLAAVASDTAAYYTGCLWGRHKIWPRVSPKKSWEGSIGGFLGCIAVTVIVGYVPLGGQVLGSGTLWHLLVLGAVLNIVAQFGDFFESALKRVCKVKDSSALLPGHGGVLDRIDSLLFVLAAYSFLSWAYIYVSGLAALTLP